MMGKVGGRQEAHQSGDAPGVPGLLRGGGFFVGFFVGDFSLTWHQQALHSETKEIHSRC
jgi:hypothetical protein